MKKMSLSAMVLGLVCLGSAAVMAAPMTTTSANNQTQAMANQSMDKHSMDNQSMDKPMAKHSMANQSMAKQVAPAPTLKALATADKLSDLPQVYSDMDFLKQDKEKLGGGTGTIHAAYAFPRTTATAEQAIKEIAWLTIPAGSSIGLHQHANNEDAYIIVKGHGVFTDTLGKSTPVGPGDVTIARPGNKHGLANTGMEDLVILDVVAMNDTYMTNHPMPKKSMLKK